ncbi:hypothetical protein K7W42_20205 [Deinococcus sp. HMF7604]|uniref:hypothetical protein n=1 Tax=Deinococcus betulae TaxID=2873312 RepID=UPI001CCFB5A5|nr:hypothetical protein [Deinococcus betulae]MBZ9753163.1 hypothetical protein [Deinococcus betulae]
MILGLTYLGLNRPAPIEPISLPSAQGICQMSAVFEPRFDRESDSVVRTGNGFLMAKSSWLEAEVCSPGILRVRAEGTAAAGIAPRLRVTVGSKEIFRDFIWGTREVDIDVPVSGMLRLHYDNDYYRAELRLAQLSSFQLSTQKCTGFEVEFPPETGGIWDRVANTASLAFRVPMTLRPCGPGKLSFQLTGLPGGGIYPKVEIRQGQDIHRVIEARARTKRIELDVNGQPVTLTVINPYNRRVEDRNLLLKDLSFLEKRTQRLSHRYTWTQ